MASQAFTTPFLSYFPFHPPPLIWDVSVLFLLPIPSSLFLSPRLPLFLPSSSSPFLLIPSLSYPSSLPSSSDSFLFLPSPLPFPFLFLPFPFLLDIPFQQKREILMGGVGVGDIRKLKWK